MKRLVLVLLIAAACTQSHSLNLQSPVGISQIPGTDAAIVGFCRASDGSVLPGVTVTVRGDNGYGSMGVTDSNGHYAFASLPPGRYTLKWDLVGYGSCARGGIVVAAGQLANVTGTINAAVSETVTVTAAAPMMDGRRTGTLTTVSMSDPPSRSNSRNVNGATHSVPALMVDAVDQPFYAAIEENGFHATQDQAVTTFSIDVDKASYSNVRRFLNNNLIPPPDAVRIEEMVNYFTYHYPPPADGRPFAVSSEVAGCPWNAAHRLLRIGIQARSLQSDVAPNNLVFLLDVSGSMSPPDRLPLIKSALRLLVSELRGQDSVAIVVYAGAAGMVLPPTAGSDKATILASLDQLQAGGSTNGADGIKLAYKVAKEKFLAKGNNRVILATDGDFNVGTSTFEELTKLIEEQRTRGIYLTCLGVGNDNLQDGKIELLADKGNGNYFYLDGIAEAKKVFQRELAGTLVSVADDVKVQLAFDPSAVVSYRQIGYENRALHNKDFTDDTKDAGELGAGHSVTALYELEPRRTSGTIATLKIRYKDPGAASSQEVAATITDETKSVYDATPDTQFAAAVAELGMLLRNSTYKGTSTWADVIALARATRGEDVEGYREEFIRMVESGRGLLGDRKVARK